MPAARDRPGPPLPCRALVGPAWPEPVRLAAAPCRRRRIESINIVAVRDGVRPLAHRWLRLLRAGALLACSLLSAGSYNNAGNAQSGSPAAKSWSETAATLSLSKEPARSRTSNPGPEHAAIGELPPVTVEARRDATCPEPHDRLAAPLPEPTQRQC